MSNVWTKKDKDWLRPNEKKILNSSSSSGVGLIIKRPSTSASSSAVVQDSDFDYVTRKSALVGIGRHRSVIAWNDHLSWVYDIFLDREEEDIFKTVGCLELHSNWCVLMAHSSWIPPQGKLKWFAQGAGTVLMWISMIKFNPRSSVWWVVLIEFYSSGHELVISGLSYSTVHTGLKPHTLNK